MSRLFNGLGTALITPFEPNGEISWKALDWLIDYQIDKGVDFLVPCGTTGESPTLTHDEHDAVIHYVVEKCAGKIPVLAGTGSNSTAEAVRLTTKAKEFGADGALVIYPYYNKPTETGTVRHFEEVAKVGLPVVYYHIPGRAPLAKGFDIFRVIKKLAEDGTIVGIKWSDDNTFALRQIIDFILDGDLVDDFSILSGDDTDAHETIKMGGHGVISVLSHITPSWLKDMVKYLGGGEFDLAENIHKTLLPLMKSMFLETNPIPVKTALSIIRPDIFSPSFRLPLSEMDENLTKMLYQTLKETPEYE